MSYKFGMILSMIMVVAFFLLAGDMISMSAAYSALDSTSISIGYLIAKTGRVDQEYITYLEDSYEVNFKSISNLNPSIGDVIEFVIYREYQSLIMSKNPISLEASRTTVIGYYG